MLSSRDFSPVLDAASLDIIQRTLTYLFQHFAEDLKLPEVAELAGMTESTFSRFFQKNTGNSFSEVAAGLGRGLEAEVFGTEQKVGQGVVVKCPREGGERLFQHAA